MDWEQIDWPALRRLRTAFLEGTAGAQDYWQSESDLASYDLTFAQRISWKWDGVLHELDRRRWAPPPGPVLDWGCGSGIAGRAFFAHYGVAPGRELQLWDRSALAMRFARRRARQRFPQLPVELPEPGSGTHATLLLSHVLTELSDDQSATLLDLIRQATAVLWIEPGTRGTSRRLSQLREELRGSFHLVAPCLHREGCGMLAPDKAHHWCHHFAAPPPAVFTDGNWARFAELAGIDLRSLPMSFLVLDKRPVRQADPGQVRQIGRARVYKGHALVLGCDETGVRERRLSQRQLPEAFRGLRKGRGDSLQIWPCAEDEIVAAPQLTSEP